MTEEGGFRETRREMERVIRRLNALEFLILLAAALLALVGGALVAFLLTTGTELPFRLVWAALSILFFIIPGVAVLGRERNKSRKDRTTPPRTTEHDG